MTRADERGQMGGIEVLPFGLLVFVVGALLVASAWAVVDVKVAVTAAAREGARTWVEGPPGRPGEAAAQRAARDAFAGHGRDPTRLTVELRAEGGFRRCEPVVVRASATVPAVSLPWIGGLGEVTVSASHTELVDPFRDDVPGEQHMLSRRERGSVLILMPAAVLVVVLLAAITVDTAVVLLGERQLADVAAAAANDAVTAGIDESRFRRDGTIVLDEARVRVAVDRTISAHRLEVDVTDVTVAVDGNGRSVRVTITGTVAPVFARAIPGAGDPRTVSATASATALTSG